MNKIFFSLLLSFFILPVFALQTIRGKIIDGTTNQPLDFVNIALLKEADSAPATGVVSDEKGDFELPRVPNGKYTLRVSFVGYNTIELPLRVTDKELNMGLIKLLEDSKSLSEVEVIGQGTQMRFEIDKKVFSVDQNIASAGGSATEVLQNIPSIDVDNEGNVSLRNNSSVEVWINGKPSGLTVENRAQILQQMPAESIESIEIMTNPSAKFNPEGTSGIINLVMKKNRRGGYYGSASLGTVWSQGSNPGISSGLNYNYSSGKFDAYINLGYRAMNFAGGGWSNRYFLNGTDTTSLLRQDNNRLFGYSGLFTRAGIDFRINDKNSIGLSGFGMLGTGGGNNNTNYVLTNYLNPLGSKDYNRYNVSDGGRPGMNVSLDYKLEIDKKGSNLMSSLSYSTHNRYSDETYLQRENANNDTTSYLLQTNQGQSEEIQFKLDYTQKFTENDRLEAGWQSTLQDRFGPNSGKNLLTNQPIYEYYNEFKYAEQIHATYLTYGTRINKLSLQGGLRAEYYWRHPINTVMDANGNLQTNDYNSKGQIQLFPSFFASYSLPDNNELQFNASRRISRPRGRNLNPFRDYSDSTNISYGNLELLPEYTTVMELNYLKTWDKHSLSSTIYHRFTDDVIQRVSYVNGPVMENTYMNVTKSQSSGFEFVIKNNLFKILNLTSSLNLYYNKLDSSAYTNPYNQSIVTVPGQENFTWSGRVIGNVILGKNTFGQITGQYSAPRLIAQGRETASYSIDLGLRQSLLNRNLSLNFMVRDVFDTRRRSSVTWGEGFYQQSESYFHGRMLGLTATYNFGNMKPRKTTQRKENGGGGDEMGGFGED
ncbi:MAG: outer membrane beta-barrel family protein [Paludibacter sp.]|nr:outer membrane beta-barrel family protein [Paludibacter sp.]